MKNLLISLVALAFVASMATAQHRGDLSRYDQYVPNTLDGVSAMTALTVATSLDDTTNSIDTRGWGYVGVNLKASADSVGVLVAVQGSVDGINWSTFTTVDSLISRTTTVADQEGFAMPDDFLSFPYLRVRLTGSADGNFGANPTPTVAVKVVRRK